ncbi:MAG: tripartite tricarboxylate transporter substrate-binding protein, partial [Burkholderiaceae bacterium]|nr:tripartite tricarboxylate transporter substrate-binding protein [Burkholderiaceae bacterium]
MVTLGVGIAGSGQKTGQRMPRSGHSEHPAGVRHQFGMLSAFSVERCPPSRWNTVRHQRGIVSAMAWNTQVNGFATIGLLAEVPFALAVDARLPVQNLKDLLALPDAKREMTVAHAQFDAQLKLLAKAMATPILGVPYQGGALAMSAVLSGEIPAVMSAVPALAGQVKAGKLRFIGIGSGKRVSAFPDRPTFVEQGYPEFVTSGWMSVLAPKGTPEAVLRRLSEATQAVVKDQSFVERIRASGAEPLEGGAAETLER